MSGRPQSSKADINLNDLKKHDIIICGSVREEVLGRLEDLVFTQRLYDSGARGPVSGATEISDLVMWGFRLETGSGEAA